MSNLFLNLPLPVANGPGAAVDVSAMGGPRTITALGTFPGTTITIEVSNDGGLTFAPLTLFQNIGGERVVPIAAQWMRTNVGGRKPAVPFAANVDVGAPATGGLFAVLPMPAGDGPGLGANIAAFGTFATVIATGGFAGVNILVEISEDGVDWAPLMQFAGYGGVQSRLITATFARVNVSGRRAGVPFTAVVALGAISLGGSVAPSGIGVEDENVPIPGAPFTVLDFVGQGVLAADLGGGRAQIAIPGGIGAIKDEGVALIGAPFQVMNFVGGGVMAINGPPGQVDVLIPGAPPAAMSGGFFWGADSVGAAVVARFLPPGHDFAVAPTTDSMQIPIYRAGTLKNLVVRHNSAGGNGQPVTYTVLVNGVATGITCNLATGAVGQASDIVNTVVVAFGDRVSIRADKNANIGGGNLDVEASLELA